MALEPGELPPKNKLIPTKRSDGSYELDRVRHRALNGEVVRTSAVGRTKKECIDEWMRRFDINNRKGSKRRRISKRVQFAPTDPMSKVFAEMDRQWKQRVEDGTLSRDTHSNYHRTIYPCAPGPKNHNPDAFKLETEMGDLSIAEAADAADITDYLDEVAETAPSRAEMQHLVLGMAFKMAVLGRGLPTSDNPMPHVICPPRKPTIPRPLARPLQISMYAYIVEARSREGAYLRLYYLFLLGTGVRPGEGLAVRWVDIATEMLEDSSVRTVAYIGATVRRRTKVGTFRHPNRKSGNPYWIVLPQWLAAELAAEKARVRPASDEVPVFRGPVSHSWVSVQSAEDSVLRLRRESPVPDFRLSDLRDTVASHIASVTKDDDRSSAQLGHTDGKLSIAQKYYISAEAKRVAVVDNADELELLNPLDVGANWESDGVMSV
ncbi:hypothetical protein [Nocardia sp. NPDC059239]|uniref:hypothetical protein n=1 Tax=unclassified Nocardia TaxID=2637762 RepID=UPI0036C7B21B